MPEIDQQKLLTVFREYYTQIDLSRIPTKEKLALILFKSMPHMFTFLENRLDIIHGVKLAREKK